MAFATLLRRLMKVRADEFIRIPAFKLVRSTKPSSKDWLKCINMAAKACDALRCLARLASLGGAACPWSPTRRL